MGGEQSEASQHPCRHRRPEGEPATTYEHVIEVLGASRLKGFDRNIADVLGGGDILSRAFESRLFFVGLLLTPSITKTMDSVTFRISFSFTCPINETISPLSSMATMKSFKLSACK